MIIWEPEFLRKPTPALPVVFRYVPHQRRSSMANPNQNPGQQNPGQQNQTPGQKPGQQQGGGQKPGQQQQDPSRQGQTPNPQKDR
jgi:hypothetical protein